MASLFATWRESATREVRGTNGAVFIGKNAVAVHNHNHRLIGMGKKQPHIIVPARPNGAGKSTTAPVLLRDTFSVDEFVNADVIARGLSAFAPESVTLGAGKIMLRRLRDLAQKGERKNAGEGGAIRECY